MDYRTIIGLSREKIRLMAKLIRKQFNIMTIELPVLKLLETIVTKYDSVLFYDIEEDEKFESNVPAYLATNKELTKFCIHIKESVYQGAVDGKGDCLGFITHELCHFILLHIFGIVPENYCFDRQLEDEKIPAYKSSEWQAKAMCGELMIPYDECTGKNLSWIKENTKSSTAQIEYFLDIVDKK